jgi:hypothetical protein
LNRRYGRFLLGDGQGVLNALGDVGGGADVDPERRRRPRLKPNSDDE